VFIAVDCFLHLEEVAEYQPETGYPKIGYCVTGRPSQYPPANILKALVSTRAEPIENSRTILIIDDQHAVRVTLAFLLNETYRVIAAESGPKAIALATEENIEGALIDLHMPVMDGFEACQRLQAQAAAASRTLRVWFMSAAFTTEARRRAEELGAVGVFTKPFDHDQLFAGLKQGFASPPPSASVAVNSAIPAESNAPS